MVSRDRIDAAFSPSEWYPPSAILVGGEGPWTSGDAALDAVLERWAVAHAIGGSPSAAAGSASMSGRAERLPARFAATSPA